jgi:hypothetical protein
MRLPGTEKEKSGKRSTTNHAFLMALILTDKFQHPD